MTEPAPITVERRIAAPPTAVYPYLVEADLTPRWLGETSAIDPSPGGRFYLQSPNAMVAEGTVVEIVPNRRVCFTWGWNGHPGVPPGSTLVEIDLIPDGDGTLVRLTHSQLATEEQELHTTGWAHYLERLAAVVSGTDPGSDPGAAG